MKERLYLPGITILSVVIPLVVALLLYLPDKEVWIHGFNYRLLPFINACINSTVTILLITGFYFIRKKNIVMHRICMISSLIFSTLFLVIYVFYHSQVPETKFGGVGFVRYFYFFVLITHIILATVVVPLALLSIFRGLNMQIVQHRLIARFTLPIWLYVSVTGVIVYILISPYYTY